MPLLPQLEVPSVHRGVAPPELTRSNCDDDSDDDDDILAATIQRMRPPVKRRSYKSKTVSNLAALMFSKAEECSKCEVVQKKFDDHRRLAFLETEHLRRGLEKMLETCAQIMNPATLQQLQDTLQLNVRYLTKPPEEVQGTDASPIGRQNNGNAKSGGGGGESALAERLRKENAMLEEELKTARAQLRNQGNTTSVGVSGAIGGRRALSGQGGKAIEVKDAMCQVDLTKGKNTVEAAHPDGQSHAKAVRGDAGPANDNKANVASSNGKKAIKREDDDFEDRSERVVSDQPRGGGVADVQSDAPAVRKKQRKPRMPGTPAAGTAEHRAEHLADVSEDEDDDDSAERLADVQRQLARAMSEKNLLDMKLTSAEKAKTKAEQITTDLEKSGEALRQEIVELKQRLADLQTRYEALASKACGKVSASPDAAQGQKSSGKKKKKGPDIPVAEKKGVKKRFLISEQEGGNGTASGGGGDVEGDAIDGMDAEHASEGDGPDDEEEESEYDDDSEVEMVDKCVGNGPDPVMEREPLRCLGQSIFEKPADLNRTGRCYVREDRPVPKLGAPGVPIAGRTTQRGFAASAPAATTLATEQVQDAGGSKANLKSEPYLAKLWDHQQKGNRLQKLLETRSDDLTSAIMRVASEPQINMDAPDLKMRFLTNTSHLCVG